MVEVLPPQAFGPKREPILKFFNELTSSVGFWLFRG